MHIWNVSRTVSIAKYLCCCFVLFGLRRAVSSEMRHSSLNHRPTLYRFCVILCASAGGFLCVFRLLISHAQPEFFNQLSDRHAFPNPTVSLSFAHFFLRMENERTKKNINRTAQTLVQCVRCVYLIHIISVLVSQAQFISFDEQRTTQQHHSEKDASFCSPSNYVETESNNFSFVPFHLFM